MATIPSVPYPAPNPVADGSAFDGASTPNTGTDTSNTLSRDIHVGVLESFKRRPTVADMIDSRTVSGGTGAQFTVEGKEDDVDTGVDNYVAGSKIKVSNGTQDELVINLDRPQYVARRIDDWDAAVANYDVMAMNQRQVGSKLLNVVDRKAVAAVKLSAAATTNLVNNGTNTVVSATAIASGATPEARGDALAGAIYEASASIRENDDFGELYAIMTPSNYNLLVQSNKAVNADFTNGNGGFDSGTVYQIGGITMVQTNNFPADAGLECIVFGEQAAGIVKLWDIKTKVVDDPDYLSAKRLQAFFSNGMAPLRPQSACQIVSV